MVDKRGEKEVGKLLGADFIITGSFSIYEKTMRIDIKLTDVNTGMIIGFSQRGNDENTIHRLSEAIIKYLTGTKITRVVQSPDNIIPQEPVIRDSDTEWYEKWYIWAIIGATTVGIVAAASSSSSGGNGGDGGTGRGGWRRRCRDKSRSW